MSRIRLTAALLLVLVSARGAAANKGASESDRPLTEVRQLTRGSVELIPTETTITTTISLPGPIEAMDGKGFAVDEKKAGMFDLSFTPGSSRFSVNPLQKGVKSNLNVVVGGNLYTLYFVEKQGTGVFSVEFVNRKAVIPVAKKQNLLVSPQRLVGLLDKCKSYHLLVGTHPEVLDDLETVAPHHKIDNGDFDLIVRNVYRKHEWDTVVFDVELVNKTDKPIYYDPEGWSARVNSEVFYQSVGDSAGVINPQSRAEAWFAITGDQLGGTNDLDVNNVFQVAVQTVEGVPKTKANAKATPLEPFYAQQDGPKKASVVLEAPASLKK